MLDGDPAPLLRKGAEPSPPQFSALDHCSQTVECIKAAPGTDLGLAPGHIVLDGDPALLPQKGAEPPLGGPSLLWPNGWMHQDVTWYGGRPHPSDFVLDGDCQITRYMREVVCPSGPSVLSCLKTIKQIRFEVYISRS